MNSHQYGAEHNEERLEKSLGDYVTDTIIPLCIIGLMMSFVYFLIDLRAVYYGDYDSSKLRWVYFWFIIAAVCINRIGAMYGSNLNASPYALGLGAAMILFLLTRGVHGLLLVNIAAMLLIWWVSSRLTKECTLSDSDEDSSGQGLLSSIISESKWNKESVRTSQKEEVLDSNEFRAKKEGAESSKRKEIIDPQNDWFARQMINLFSRGKGDLLSADKEAPNKEQKSRSRIGGGAGRHPGISVIYFSIIALTTFGLGERKLASLGRFHTHSFSCMILYIFFALALLMLTSFSGLRHYLRQRAITMSKEIASLWLILGTIIILLVIGVSYILPRSSPSSQGNLIERWTQQIASKKWLETFKSKVPDTKASGKKQYTADRTASSPREMAFEKHTRVQRRKGAASRQLEGQTSSASKDNNMIKGLSESSGAKNERKRSTTNAPSNANPREQTQSQGDSSDTNDLSKEWLTQRNKVVKTAESIREKVTGVYIFIFKLINIIIKIALLLVALYIAWRILKAILILLQSQVNWSAAFLLMIERLRIRLANFLSRFLNLFKLRSRQVSNESQPSKAARYSRKIYNNPFTSKKLLAKLTCTELVIYSYKALMARADEIGCARQENQTPYEYARNLPGQLIPLKSEILHLTHLYVQAVYTPYEISQKDLKKVKVFWERFERTLIA